MRYLFALFAFLNCCSIQGQQNSDVYDLEFRRYASSDFPWSVASFISGKGGCNVIVDTAETIGGKHPLVFGSMEMFPANGLYYRFYACLSQQLFLPNDYQQLVFTLHVKCLNIVQGWLKIVALDEKEQYLYRDSVSFGESDEWHRCSLEVATEEACFFRVEICATGRADWQQPSAFSIDRIEVLGDGRSINWRDKLPVLSADDFDCIGSWPESALPFLKNKRIVALAETVHGDSLIATLGRELISRWVEQDECKLVLMELPYDHVLLFNLYIHGNSLIQESELVQYAQTWLHDTDFDLVFLNKLRTYNRQAKDKVHIVGVNRMSWEMHYLFRFYECVSGKKLGGELLAKLLKTGKIIEAIEEFETNGQLTEGWDAMDVYWFSTALKQLEEQEDCRELGIEVDYKREGIMKNNVISIVNALLPQDKKAVVVGHWLHFNKVNTMAPILQNSCGGYLRQEFGDDYGVVGILKGKGYIRSRTWRTSQSVSHFLALPQGKEFWENVCSDRNETVFFGQCSNASRVGWIRISGCYAYRFLCVPVVLSQRVDAFLWVP